jgi:hypothetical protein
MTLERFLVRLFDNVFEGSKKSGVANAKAMSHIAMFLEANHREHLRPNPKIIWAISHNS